ncbi:DUF2490 domain-containing protein [Galbibacter mesophilus]|uniref:DUF2490 domain-containing protein n=1 Tax=Galbibacter mesophilus TaxID=379069 RepID=UPI00191D38E6|nr:DUF2490 domain-containing protein [Galbibacter mesophilus]MCM5664106.1 DUF2490 domain-containing protein [Galbibacter mesophilus]
MQKNLKTLNLLIFLICGCFSYMANAQEDPQVLPEESEFKPAITKYWLNTYGNIRISKRMFWVAQTHFRFEETEDTPFVGQLGQIYNRHAIGYIVSKKFDVALGGVVRFNFNTDPDSDGKTMVPEWRIWQQYRFAMPVSRLMFYHRIRIENRWSKGFEEGDDYIYRTRWRYMFRVKIPVNRPKLEPKAFYIGPEAEVIMQSGKEVVDSPLEDLRLHTSFGYILTPRLTVAAGIMYNFGQNLDNGGIYKQGWTIRTHLYFSPDFRKVRNKLPSIHTED